jgi:hypothetical protein
MAIGVLALAVALGAFGCRDDDTRELRTRAQSAMLTEADLGEGWSANRPAQIDESPGPKNDFYGVCDARTFVPALQYNLRGTQIWFSGGIAVMKKGQALRCAAEAARFLERYVGPTAETSFPGCDLDLIAVARGTSPNSPLAMVFIPVDERYVATLNIDSLPHDTAFEVVSKACGKLQSTLTKK